jgi:hypothetical protein
VPLRDVATSDPAAFLMRVRARLEAALHDAEVVERMHRAAAAIIRVPRNTLAARELVADVVGDTYAGTLAWDPDQVPLWKHVRAHVKQRVRQARRTAAMHTSLPEVSDEMVQLDARRMASGDAAWRIDPADAPALLDDLRHRAAGDRDVLELLSLYERGITRKARILGLGMSDGQYRNARRRLIRLAITAADALASKDTSATAKVSTPLPTIWTGTERGERRSGARAVDRGVGGHH